MLDVLLGMILAFFTGLVDLEGTPESCVGVDAEAASQQPCPPPSDSTRGSGSESGLIKVGGSGLTKVGGSG